MEIESIVPPRSFAVGRDKSIHIRHCASISLQPDEQVTFVTSSGTEYDVVRKSWGYYATPSLNKRLRDHSLRAVLVRGSRTGRMYLLLVEVGCEQDFHAYVDSDGLQVVCWLDNDEAVERVASTLMDCEGRPRCHKNHDY